MMKADADLAGAERSDDEVTDVLVIGAGIAGLTAALSAREAGLDVVLIEKGARYGGTSAIAGGGFAFAGTDLQAAAGIRDDADAYRRDLWVASKGQARPELLDAFVAEQLSTYQWLVGQGVGFSLFRSGAQDGVDRAHTSGQGAAVARLRDRLEEAGICYRPSTAGKVLIREHRVVRGAQISSGVESRTIRTRHGVILATGGFNRNDALLQTYAPQWVSAMRLGGAHNEGDGMRMAMALGAAQADMGYIEPSFGGTVASRPGRRQEVAPTTLLLPFTHGAIIVNRAGRRFVNEDLNYKEISHELLRQPGEIAFQIFDQKLMARSRPDLVVLDLRGGLDRGDVQQAPTIRALAEGLGIDPNGLAATITTYNRHAVSGTIEPDFGRPISRLGGDDPRIDTPPFYAIPSGNVLTSTLCGLAIDAKARVLDVYGASIKGLCAAGEIIGGFHGGGYYSASSLTKGAVFGRIAARTLAGGHGMPIS